MISSQGDWFPEGEIDSVRVTVSVEGSRLRLVFPDGTGRFFELSRLSVKDYMKGIPLKAAIAETGMLSLPDGPLAEEIARRCRPVGAHFESRMMVWIPALFGVAIVVMALLIFVVVPGISERVAPRLPFHMVASIGDTVEKQIQPWIDTELETEEQTLAFQEINRMGRDLTEPLDEPYNFRFLLDVSEKRINAFALPNGTIIMTYDLYQELDADEVAGVLAHEIVHVTKRHGTEAFLASSTWFVLAAFLFPDPTLFSYLPFLAEMSYSREAEYEADCEATELLKGAGYPPVAIGDALEELRGAVAEAYGFEEEEEEGSESVIPWGILSTHPEFPERIERARQCAGLEG